MESRREVSVRERGRKRGPSADSYPIASVQTKIHRVSFFMPFGKTNFSGLRPSAAKLIVIYEPHVYAYIARGAPTWPYLFIDLGTREISSSPLIPLKI